MWGGANIGKRCLVTERVFKGYVYILYFTHVRIKEDMLGYTNIIHSSDLCKLSRNIGIRLYISIYVLAKKVEY